MKETSDKNLSTNDSALDTTQDNPTPLRCFSASAIAAVLSFGLYLLFNSIVQTYATKAIVSTNTIVINLASAVRTLVMGTTALATGVCGMVAIGLFLLGIQVTIQNFKQSKT